MRKGLATVLGLAFVLALVLLLLPRDESPASANPPAPVAPTAPAPAPAPAAPAPPASATIAVRFPPRDALLDADRLRTLRVRVAPADGEAAPAEGRLDRSGACEIGELPPGRWRVEVVDESDRVIGEQAVELPPGERIEVLFTLHPPCDVEAEVVGLPSGSTAELVFRTTHLLRDEPDATLAIEAGRARGEVPTGEYAVEVVREGESLGAFVWTIEGSPARRTFDLRSLVTVSGTVRGLDGAADVTFSPTEDDGTRYRDRTDVDGAFSVRLPRGVYGVRVDDPRGAQGFGVRRFDFDTRLDLSLAETGFLEVRLTDRATGEPLADCPLFFSGPGASFTRRTDEDGRLTVELAPKLWHATATVNGAHLPALGPVLVRSGETTEVEAALAVPARGTVSGRVLFRGKPVADVQVCQEGVYSVAYDRTDRKGRFRLDPLYGRLVRILVRADPARGWAWASVRVPTGNENVVIELEPLAAGTLRFVGPDGPIRRKLTGLIQDETGDGHGFVTGGDGVLGSLGLPAGRHELRVTLNGPFVPVSDRIRVDLPANPETPIEVDVVPAVPTTLEFEIPFRGWYVLRRIDAGPAPLALPSFVYEPARSVRASRRAPAGEYRVRAFSFDGWIATGRARLGGESAKIEMTIPGGGIDLTVLEASGVPAAGVPAKLLPAADAAPDEDGPITRRLASTTFDRPDFTDAIERTTDAPGRAAFPGLLPGRYRVVLPDREVEVEVGDGPVRRTIRGK